MLLRPHTRRFVTLLLATACFAVGAGGCGVRKPQFTELLWPPAPLKSRVKFVGLLRDQRDLGRPVGELMAEAVLGEEESVDSIARPMGLAPSRDGSRLYVSDYDQQRVVVFNFETRRMDTLGGPEIEFAKPMGIAVDAADDVYVVDSVRRLVRVFDSAGAFRGNIESPKFERPTGIAVDSVNDAVYVVDSARKDSPNHVVHVLGMDGTYRKTIGGLGRDDGKFFFPTYAAVDRDGNLLVTDTLNSRVEIFDKSGEFRRSIGSAGDGFGQFHKPKDVAVDSFGNIYVVDSVWSNVQIFNARGDVLLYFAGRGGIPGLLNNPTGVTIDARNRIYVADSFNARVAIYELINTDAGDSFENTESRGGEEGGAAGDVAAGADHGRSYESNG